MGKRAPEADKDSRREIVGPVPWRCAAIGVVERQVDGSELRCVVAMLVSLDNPAKRFMKHLHRILVLDTVTSSGLGCNKRQ